MVTRNNSDSPSHTKQKEDKQMSSNLEMLRPGIQMVDTMRTIEKGVHHKPKPDEHPRVYIVTVSTSFKAANQCTHMKRMEGGPVPLTYASA